MNVLITGGYGFVGSFVAERFYKEGYKVFILDNSSTGDKRNISFKHKSFEMDIIDEKCSKIFETYTFDVVVHLAAQPSISVSFDKPYNDALSNVVGLVNILELSRKKDVKRFIFISTASVYDTECETRNFPADEKSATYPRSPHSIGKLAGEGYCKLFNEKYGLSTIVLRASNIYGPRQIDALDVNVMPGLLKRAAESERLRIPDDGSLASDFVYVEDVADAVFRCVESDYSGVLNLSSRAATSILSLTETLEALTGIKDRITVDPGSLDFYGTNIDNTKIKRELDWVPMYSIKEGISKTLEWFRTEYKERTENKDVNEKDRGPKGRLGIIAGKIRPYFENLALFVILFLVQRNIPVKELNYLVDPSLLYIIIIGIVYGTLHSVIAVALSSLLYIFSSFESGKDIISLFYDSNSLLRIAIYLIVGYLVGYAIDARGRALKDMENKLDTANGKLEFVTQVYNETKTVKDELQKQIRMSGDSLTKVYGIIKELDTLSPEKVYSSAVQVLERIMKTKSIAIYSINSAGSYARLIASSASISAHIAKSRRIDDNPDIKRIIETGELYVNMDFNPDMPSMMAPVKDNGVVVALLSVVSSDFEKMSLYYTNFFKIVSEFISSSLTRAIRYNEATRDLRYVESTKILKFESFREVLDNKIRASEEEVSSYVLLKIDAEGELRALGSSIEGSIREMDYMGLGKDGMLYVVLTNTREDEAGYVIRRLGDKRIGAVIINGEDLVT
jgi:nucleoside-diphosphate-sugar epimerase